MLAYRGPVVALVDAIAAVQVGALVAQVLVEERLPDRRVALPYRHTDCQEPRRNRTRLCTRVVNLRARPRV